MVSNLFSRTEMEYVVKQFILAYIRGQITISVKVEPETYKRSLERAGLPVDEAQAFDEAQKLTLQIPNTMLKCAGLIETTEEEYRRCIEVLFKFLILGRVTKSIDVQVGSQNQIAVLLLHHHYCSKFFLLSSDNTLTKRNANSNSLIFSLFRSADFNSAEIKFCNSICGS
jgi:hypothetical protein